MTRDGIPYLRMDRATFLIGMIGLNELVQIQTGAQLHESREALKMGLKIIGRMKEEAEKLGRKKGMRFVLEQTPRKVPLIDSRGSILNISPRLRAVSSKATSRKGRSTTIIQAS